MRGSKRSWAERVFGSKVPRNPARESPRSALRATARELVALIREQLGGLQDGDAYDAIKPTMDRLEVFSEADSDAASVSASSAAGGSSSTNGGSTALGDGDFSSESGTCGRSKAK